MQIINDLINRLRLTYRLMNDTRVPITTKMIPIAVIVYIVSPLDLMPFIPIDDIAVLIAGLRAFEALVPDYIVHEHRSALGMIEPTA